MSSEEQLRADISHKKMVAAVRLAAAGRTLALAADQFNELSTLMTTPDDVLEELGAGTAHEKRQAKRVMARTAFELAKEAVTAALSDVSAALGS